MSEADREIQAAARAFVDELIPHEVEAELHDGELPAELLEHQRRRVHELGFDAVNMPKEATAFARQRRAYGRPILDYQAIQFMLADSLTELWAARLMTYRTAHGIDDGLDVKVQHAHCSMAKLYASEMAGRVADRAVQVFGGRGYMRENVAERFYRELRVDRIWEGTSEIQRTIVADQLAKRGVGRLIG